MNSNLTDFWKVNSYGYPNPFSADQKARQAWETYLSFFDFTSYDQLKRYWESTAAPRRLNAHALESWKATFEEFGLLYVPSRSDEIRITPAGTQIREAADREDEREFGWIGLSLLLRYPLRGPRRARGARYQGSDLLLYWFLYAALIELDNYIWWTELERILCQVFRVEEAALALGKVRELRADSSKLEQFPPLVENPRGGFYNSLNQVMVHAGMYYLTLGKSADDSFYTDREERKHWILSDWLATVKQALGGKPLSLDCDSKLDFISRMPSAPHFSGDVTAYFDYLGAKVSARSDLAVNKPIQLVNLQGETVVVLQKDSDYAENNKDSIVGAISRLCKLARGQRLILSHSLQWSYIITDKTRIADDKILVTVRRGKPITDRRPILSILEGKNG